MELAAGEQSINRINYPVICDPATVYQCHLIPYVTPTLNPRKEYRSICGTIRPVRSYSYVKEHILSFPRHLVLAVILTTECLFLSPWVGPLTKSPSDLQLQSNTLPPALGMADEILMGPYDPTAIHPIETKSRMLELQAIFEDLGLAEYMSRLDEHGFDTWDAVVDMTESDMATLGIKLGTGGYCNERMLVGWVIPMRILWSIYKPLSQKRRRDETEGVHHETLMLPADQILVI